MSNLNTELGFFLVLVVQALTTPWPGLPKGVKFEPTDEEVIQHLEAKCGIDGLKPHLLIQDFICSVTEDVGINYTHPQNLPGKTNKNFKLLIQYVISHSLKCL